MKNILLFLIVILVGINGIAQKGLKYKEKFGKVEITNKVNPDFEQPYLNQNISATTANKGADIIVGTTKFDMQSYGSVSRHIWAWDDGTVGIVWTRGMDDGYPDRGTGYNYFDGTDWGPIPTERIENDRTGWSEMSEYGENGEIVCAHAYPTGTILFSYRENKGTGEWQYFSLESPAKNIKGQKGGPELVWPRMCVTGADKKTIHVLCMVGWGGFEYEGLKSALAYSRTTDGGETWDPYMEILDGMTSDDYPGAGADEYMWAVPKGDTIAFVLFNGLRDGFIMKSTDAGESWEKITFYESPDPFFDGNSGDLPQCGGGDGSNAIAIDKDGLVHVAFGRQIHIDETPDDDTWSFYPFSDGLVYWNETMDPLDTAAITNAIIPQDWSTTPIYQHGQLAAYTQPTSQGDSLADVAAYYCSLTSMPKIAFTENGKGDEILSIIYSGVALGYINDETSSNYRHIFKVQTEMDGKWSQPEDLTGDVFHLASECVFPSMMAKNGTFHITYQTSNLPGIAGYDDHEPVINNIVYLPATLYPVGKTEVKSVNFEVGQNRPNPATSNTLIDVKAPKGEVSLNVINSLGQTVFSAEKISNGKFVQFSVNVKDFNSGVYFYTVKTGDKSLTKKMIVK